MRTVTFTAGLATGYVLGTRAGRQKYEEMVAAAKRLADQPLVVQTRSVAKDFAASCGQAASSKIASLAPGDDAPSSGNGFVAGKPERNGVGRSLDSLPIQQTEQ
jgi:hypothetical protein